MSSILAVGIILFLMLASAMLVWSGLAGRTSPSSKRGRGWRHPNVQLAVGVLGFALGAWIGLGMLTHAR